MSQSLDLSSLKEEIPKIMILFFKIFKIRPHSITQTIQLTAYLQ